MNLLPFRERKIKGGFETMNKNLKKVISAVAALALSVTSFAALGTASYSDVTADIKHASAINQLSAMGIIEGFEDGTFHPDEKVTRAQMAAMVVRALNIDNAESNKVQKFNDVPADNWAAGWIATATDRGILNGTGNGNFDPGLDVTYMQAAKMLVCAIGYESWANTNGGWPSGYRTYANSVGITAGISGAADDTALTRAQCAQMIANTLEAPMLVEDSMTTDYQGNPVALRVQKDGTNEDKSPFTSLLIDKWDMYVVNGKVTDSTKTEETGTAPKVRYQIEKTKNYLGTPYNTSSMYNNVVADATNNRYEAPQCLYGETGADAYLNLYTRAIIKADDYDDPEIIYIEEAGKSESITFEARLYKDGTYKTNVGTAQNTTIDVKRSASSGTATTYKLVNGYSISVNGVNVAGNQANFEKYVRDNTYATVTLTDNPTNGTSTDGVYDVVTVDYKAIAVVDEVFEKSGDIVVNFKDQARTDNAAKLEIDTESDKIYKFTKDGVAIEPTELVENDVLSIAFDPVQGFKNSAFYEVEVSQQTTTGKVTGLSQDSFGVDEYTIDGTAYSIVDGMSPSIKTGGEYTIGLTADGRIAWADRTAVSINYGIIERVYKSAAGEPTVRIIDKTGVKRTYEYAGDAEQATPSEDPTGIINRIYKASANNLTTIPLADRVVDYTITSSNEIKIKSEVQNIVKSLEVNKEYRESTGRLGSAVIDDATVVLDISDWASDFSKSAGLASKASLMDGAYYSAVVAKEYGLGGSTAVPFVAIYEGLGGWSVDSPMAVVTKTLTTSEDGQTRTQLNVIENGEEKSLVCEDDSAQYNLAEGTAFMYTTDTDGYVNDIVEVLDLSVDLASADKYDFYTAILANEADNELSAKDMANTGIINSDLYATGSVGSKLVKGSDHVEFIFAPVLNKTSSDVTIGGLTYGTVPNLKTYLTGKVNADAYYTDEAGENYAYESDISVAVYTQSNTNGYRVELGNGGSVVKSMISKSSDKTATYLDTNGTLVNLGAKAVAGADVDADPNTISFVLLKVFDDRVQAAYSIVLDEDVVPTFVPAV